MTEACRCERGAALSLPDKESAAKNRRRSDISEIAACYCYLTQRKPTPGLKYIGGALLRVQMRRFIS